MSESHENILRAAIEVARRAGENGNHPFGVLLVDEDENVLLEAENTVVTESDLTAHAELTLVRIASNKYSNEILEKCTIYASTEPCAMCSGAIFWSGIGRIVFGLSSQKFYEMIDDITPDRLSRSCRDVFAKGNRKIEIIGGMFEDEAAKVHEGFWK